MKRLLRRGLPVAMLLAAVALAGCGDGAGAPPTPSPAQPLLVIHNGRLFDGTSENAIEDGVVVIQGNRILAAGPASEVEVPPSAAIIDAGGGLIMPGVIDSHVHITDEDAHREDIFTPWLRSGVTSLVDNGISPKLTASIREMVDGIAGEAPRLFLAGPVLTAPNGYPSMFGLDYRLVESEEEGRTAVAELAGEGVDLIAVSVDAGFRYDLDDGTWPVLPAGTLAAMVEAAHQRGLTARAYLYQPLEFEAALAAGFDVTAHTPFEPLSDGLLRRAAEAGLIMVTTVAQPELTEEEAMTAVSNLRRYIELGGRAALGSNGPVTGGPNAMPVREMRFLVEGKHPLTETPPVAGLSPAQVLLAATRDAAEAIGRGDELGTLEPGKLADVIVVAGDPLADVTQMANVTVVVRDGEVVLGEGALREAQRERSTGRTLSPRRRTTLTASTQTSSARIGRKSSPNKRSTATANPSQASHSG